MTVLGNILVVLLFAIGLVGSFLPLFPGGVVIWGGILLHKLWFGADSVSWAFVVWAAVAVVVSQLLDAACTWWGARRFGASWRGALGAVLGGVVGVFTFPWLNLLGLVLGPLAGAVLAELLSDRSLREAGRAGIGTVVGGLAAFVIRIGISFGMVLSFFLAR